MKEKERETKAQCIVKRKRKRYLNREVNFEFPVVVHIQFVAQTGLFSFFHN